MNGKSVSFGVKWLAILLAAIAVVAVQVTSAYAATVETSTHGQAISNTDGNPGWMGNVIQISASNDVQLNNVTKASCSLRTQYNIWNSSWALLGTGNFTGNVADFTSQNIILKKSQTYYLMANNLMGSQTCYTTGATTFPITSKNITWVDGRYNNVSNNDIFDLTNITYTIVAPAAPNNFSVLVSDVRTSANVQGFNWNYTTTNGSDTNTKAGYCAGTNCSITNFTGSLTITVFNVSGGTYFVPYDSPKTITYNATSTNYTFNTFSNSLTVSANNTVNGSIINGLCVNASNSTYSTRACNATGTNITIYGIIGTQTILVSDIGDGDGDESDASYFNQTLTLNNFNSTNNRTIAQTFQAILSLSAYQLYTSNSITSFIITNGLLTNGTTTDASITIPANTGSNTVTVSPTGNYSKTVTCTASQLTITPCVATDFYDAILKINATNAFTHAQIKNFTGWTNYATTNLTINTTNGTWSTPAVQGLTFQTYLEVKNYSITADNARDILIDSGATNATFSLYTNNSILVTIYDAATSNLLNSTTCTVTYTNNGTQSTSTTTSGVLYTDGLKDGVYDVQVSAPNYVPASYTVTVATSSHQNLNAYLGNSTTQVVFTIIDADNGQPIPNALGTMSKSVNGSLSIVQSRTSDITGKVLYTYDSSIKYTFSFSAEGYETLTFTLDPILFSTYDLRLQRSIHSTQNIDYSGVYVDFAPKEYRMGEASTFNFSIRSANGTLADYWIQFKTPQATYTFEGNNSQGEAFSQDFNITDATTQDRVTIDYCYDTVISPIGRCFTFPYSINGAYSSGTIAYNNHTDYGLGVGERVIIAVLATIFIAGLAGLVAGMLFGTAFGLLILGFFVYIGFLPLWSVLISMLLGIILLVRRSD